MLMSLSHKVHLAFPGGIFLKNFHTSDLVVAVVLLLLGPASILSLLQYKTKHVEIAQY